MSTNVNVDGQTAFFYGFAFVSQAGRLCEQKGRHKKMIEYH
jgi:hypothetical protein